jgi:hypothetical protein
MAGQSQPDGGLLITSQAIVTADIPRYLQSGDHPDPR